VTSYGPGVYFPSVAAACAWVNHLRRTDPEEPGAARRRAIHPGSHPSCRGDVVAYLATAFAHASVQDVVGRRGDVVGACPGDEAFEVCGVPARSGRVVQPCQMIQASAPFQSRASGHNTSQTCCPP
jgi:hypothetical protein